MKLRNIYKVMTVVSLTAFSCTEYPPPAIRVDSCTFSESWNESNPYAAIYQDILDDFIIYGLPGVSVAIETPEHGWWVGCAGMASLEDEIAMQPCHLQHSASMAKTYIATMIMLLYEKGVLSLDDPARNYLPEDVVEGVANANEASIKNLLNHTSGIIDYRPIVNGIDTYNNPLADSSVQSHFEKYIFGRSADFAVGDRYEYSNTNYALLGMIIENASGMKIGDYFEQEIIQPLGLVNTFYRSSPGYPDAIPYTVNCYYEPFKGKIQNCTDFQMAYLKNSIGQSGILATPYEYGRFIQELMRGNIVDSTTLQEMINDEQTSLDVMKYGLGISHWHDIMEFDDSYGHSGGTFGSRSIMMYYPDTDVTLVFAYNLGVDASTEIMSLFNLLVVELAHVIFYGDRGKFDE